MPNRFRADLIDVAWANEHQYGLNPPAFSESVLAQTFKSGQLNTAGELWGQWGLVNQGIDLPNPSYGWEPFFGLGVLDRNMMFPIQGRETFEGRLGNVLMCHDSSRLFMEQCIGLIFSGHNLMSANGLAYSSAPNDTLTYTQSAASITVTTTTMTVGSADFSNTKPPDAGKPPIAIVIVSDTAGTSEAVNRYRDTWAFIGGHDGDSRNTILDVYQDRGLQKPGWNGVLPDWALTATTGRFSVHSIARADYDSTLQKLDVTANNAQNNASIVRPTLVQESFMIAARFRADDGSNFVVNYKGCKVSRVVFNFEEGAPINYGADFIAQDMRHNIGQDTGIGSSVKTLKYAALQTTIGADKESNLPVVIPPSNMKNIRVTEQPHFYSRVELMFQGVAIARFRNFSITVDNQLDPRFYLTQNQSTLPADDRQIIHEILEGRRNVSFSGSLDLDDAGISSFPVGSSPTDAIFLRYLLNQAYLDPDARDMSILKGIGIRIEVRRASSGTVGGATGSFPHDKMFIYLPSSSATQVIGDEDDVGLVLRSVAMNVPAPPSVHMPLEIDGFASSMHMEFMDNVADTAQAWTIN